VQVLELRREGAVAAELPAVLVRIRGVPCGNVGACIKIQRCNLHAAAQNGEHCKQRVNISLIFGEVLYHAEFASMAF